MYSVGLCIYFIIRYDIILEIAFITHLLELSWKNSLNILKLEEGGLYCCWINWPKSETMNGNCLAEDRGNKTVGP